MQIYGRVLGARSTETLLLLTLLALAAFVVMAVLDNIRSRILVRIGSAIDRRLSAMLFSATVRVRINTEDQVRSQAARDLDSLRQGIAGPLTNTVLDLPWSPIFLAAIAMADFWLGFGATVGALVLLALALMNRRTTRPLLDASNRAAMRSYALAESALRNSEVVYALGMEGNLNRRWADERSLMLLRQEAASNQSGVFTAIIKFIRMAIQVLIIAVSATLVLDGLVGPGVMFAAMLLVSRALAPIERLVGSWQAFVDARQAFVRLNSLFLAGASTANATQLPRLTGRVDFEQVSYAPGQGGPPILRGINVSIRAGETLGIIGPSGAGKSTFLKLAAGILTASVGTVRLDGADVKTWDRAHLGRFLGYLPQDVELFAGTVSENIARFDAEADDAAMFQAARLANVHDLILRLPAGYDTQLGEGGRHSFRRPEATNSDLPGRFTECRDWCFSTSPMLISMETARRRCLKR